MARRRTMTKLALRCMAFLTGIADERPTRARIAAAVQRSERTVERAIRELVEIGWISCAGGGNGTASKMRVINGMDWILAGDSKMAGDSQKVAGDQPKMAGDSSHIRALEEVHRTNSQAGQPAGDSRLCKSREDYRTGGPAHKPPGVEMPAAVIIDHLGQRIINPVWQRVRDALIASDDQIRRAREPDRYAAAIVRRAAGGGP